MKLFNLKIIFSGEISFLLFDQKPNHVFLIFTLANCQL